MTNSNKKKIKIVSAKIAFIVSIFTTFLTFGILYLFSDFNLYNNLYITISILTILFFVFISSSLFYGIRILNYGERIKLKFSFIERLANFSFIDVSEMNVDFDLELGPLGIIISIILWLLISLIVSYIFISLAIAVFELILLIVIMIYWLFYRSILLVFRYSKKCYRNLSCSIKYGLLYSFLYSGWFYGIIYMAQKFK